MLLLMMLTVSPDKDGLLAERKNAEEDSRDANEQSNAYTNSNLDFVTLG